MKIIAGAFSLANSNTSRTSLAPSPMYFLTNSEATILINVAFVSLATAFASKVLPVPGGPYNNIPLGGSIPIFSNNSGSFKGSSTVSLTSIIWSSSPPILSYVISGFVSISIPVTFASFSDGKTSTIPKVCWFRATLEPGTNNFSSKNFE